MTYLSAHATKVEKFFRARHERVLPEAGRGGNSEYALEDRKEFSL
jgi:hypothetical protein